jgi:hypothetical protein
VNVILRCCGAAQNDLTRLIDRVFKVTFWCVETSGSIAQDGVSNRLTDRIGIGALARVISADLIDEY